MCIWEHPAWPCLVWDDGKLLAAARLKQGRLLGGMASLGFDLRREAQLGTLMEDIVKSLEIEWRCRKR